MAHEIGAQVRIDIKRPSQWVRAHIKAINGSTGRIEQINPITGMILVRLEERPRPWRGNPSPGDGWWVASDDIDLVDGSARVR